MTDQDVNKQLEKLWRTMSKELRDSVNDIRLDALYQQLLLTHVFKRPEPLSAMTGWSIAPEFGWWLYNYVLDKKPNKVVELGSGVSTLIMALAMKATGVGQVISFESDLAYCQKTEDLLELCGVSDRAKVVYAPLKKFDIGTEFYRWYDIPFDLLDVALGTSGIDLLLIDGPPKATNFHARYPAYPLLSRYFHTETMVILDDAAREEERQILERWLAEAHGTCVVEQLPDIRHGSALFYVKSTAEDDDVSKFEPLDVSNPLLNLVVAEVKRLAGLGVVTLERAESLELSLAPLVEAFYFHREKSHQQLKLESSQKDVELLKAQANLQGAKAKAQEYLNARDEAVKNLLSLQTLIEQLKTERVELIAQLEMQGANYAAVNELAALQQKFLALELERDQLAILAADRELLMAKQLEFSVRENGYKQENKKNLALQADLNEQVVKLKSELTAARDKRNQCRDALEDYASKHAGLMSSLERRELQIKIAELKSTYYQSSLNYQAARALRNGLKSPFGLIKLPLALIRVLRRYKAGKPKRADILNKIRRNTRNLGAVAFNKTSDKFEVKRVVSAANTDSLSRQRSSQSNAVVESVDGESLEALILQANDKNVFHIASKIAEKTSCEQAIAFAERMCRPENKKSMNLLKASYAKSDQDWILNVNSYLRKYGLNPISLLPGSAPRFLRLVASSDPVFDSDCLVSVIMPAFNSEMTIAHAANSILLQGWRNLELIIIDDASTDSTWEICRQIQASDKRVTILRNPANVGPYVSKNIGLRIAKGRYITGQDADDWSHPQRLERHINYIKNHPNGVLAGYTGMVRMTLDGEFEACKTGDGYRRGASISAMYCAEFLRSQIGYWDTARFGADSELIARAHCILNKKYRDYSDVGMFCLISEGGLTSHPEHGVSRETGISPSRKYYREQWQQWHEKTLKRNLYLDFPHVENRNFDIPDAAKVDDENLKLVISGYSNFFTH